MSTYKILSSVTNYLSNCSKGADLLRDFGCEITATENGRPYTREELLAMISDYDAAVVGVDTWNDEIFTAAPKLKALARFGIGVDNIDLAAAKAHDVRVTNCRGINSNSVSEHAVTLMLSLLRRIPELDKSTREGKWERALFRELGSCKVGLIGFGGISQKVATKLKAFGTEVFAYDPYPATAVAEQLGVVMCDLEKIYTSCDIISIHVPALPDTIHMINKETLSKMGKNTLLINTARGAIVDEPALYEALKNGIIAGYGTDVFETDPVQPDHPLLSLPNLICTPHVAAESYENYEQTGMETAKAIIDVLSGKTPKNLLA